MTDEMNYGLTNDANYSRAENHIHAHHVAVNGQPPFRSYKYTLLGELKVQAEYEKCPICGYPGEPNVK